VYREFYETHISRAEIFLSHGITGSAYLELLQCGALVRKKDIELATELLDKMEAFTMLTSIAASVVDNAAVDAEYEVRRKNAFYRNTNFPKQSLANCTEAMNLSIPFLCLSLCLSLCLCLCLCVGSVCLQSLWDRRMGEFHAKQVRMERLAKRKLEANPTAAAEQLLPQREAVQISVNIGAFQSHADFCYCSYLSIQRSHDEDVGRQIWT
jgi:hypothetical protein